MKTSLDELFADDEEDSIINLSDDDIQEIFSVLPTERSSEIHKTNSCIDIVKIKKPEIEFMEIETFPCDKKDDKEEFFEQSVSLYNFLKNLN